MGLLLLKTNDCNLMYEFKKGTTLSVKVNESKKRPQEAVIQPLKVVLVEQGSTVITHIYRSQDQKARYDRVIVKIRETRTALWTLRNRKNSKKWNGL